MEKALRQPGYQNTERKRYDDSKDKKAPYGKGTATYRVTKNHAEKLLRQPGLQNSERKRQDDS